MIKWLQLSFNPFYLYMSWCHLGRMAPDRRVSCFTVMVWSIQFEHVIEHFVDVGSWCLIFIFMLLDDDVVSTGHFVLFEFII
jgi:hypothetical protein